MLFVGKLGVMRRKTKPCSICRRWFTPDPRVGSRQRTCGETCSKALRSKTQQKWRQRNPDYFADRRLRQQAERLESGKREDANQRSPPALVQEVPWGYVKDEMGTQEAVIISFLLRLIVRWTQSEIQRKVFEITKEIVIHSRQAAQSETDNRREFKQTFG